MKTAPCEATYAVLRDIGAQFKEARDAIPLKQREAASLMGCTAATVSSIENGKKAASIPALVKYANEIGYDIQITLIERGVET